MNNPPTADKTVQITALVVVVGFSDGKLRAVQFQGKQAKQVHGYLSHIQGGKLIVSKTPLLLVEEAAHMEMVKELNELRDASQRTLKERVVNFLKPEHRAAANGN